MIVQPTHSEFENLCWEQPFDGCPAGVGVALATTRDPAADALPCLRAALAAAGAGPAVRRARIERQRAQAPRLPVETGNWRLSLAHSGRQVAAAAADGIAVGIDLELHQPRDIPRLAQLLGWTATTASAFYPRWTLAEALYKAGAGPSPACFTAAEQALAALSLASPGALMLRHRCWHVRWHHAPAITDRPAFSACIVWSDVA